MRPVVRRVWVHLCERARSVSLHFDWRRLLISWCVIFRKLAFFICDARAVSMAQVGIQLRHVGVLRLGDSSIDVFYFYDRSIFTVIWPLRNHDGES